MTPSDIFFWGLVALCGVGWTFCVVVFIGKVMKERSFFAAYSKVDRQYPVYPRYRTIARVLDLVNERQEATSAEVAHLIERLEGLDTKSDADIRIALGEVRTELKQLQLTVKPEKVVDFPTSQRKRSA